VACQKFARKVGSLRSAYRESALVGAGFKPALTTDAGQGAIVWHSV